MHSSLCCTLVIGLLGTEVGAQPQPTAVLRPARGFVDDGFALSADGRRLYYLATDGASWAELRTAELPPGPAPKPVELAPAEPAVPAPLYAGRLWVLPGERVLVVDNDRGRGVEGKSPAAVVLTPGAGQHPQRTLGSADDVALGEVGERPAVVLYSRAPVGKAGEHKVRALDAQSGKLLGQRAFRSSADGLVQLGGGQATPLAFVDQYLTMLVRQAGEYDRKADVRQPDRLAAVDVLSGRVRDSAPVQNPTALMELVALREPHPGESTFVTHLAGEGRYELLSYGGGATLGARAPLQLPRKVGLYEPATLRYQTHKPGRVFVSLTVDPVNEAAVARKKADPDTLDLCEVVLKEGQSGQARRLAELPGNKRRSHWVLVPTAGGGVRLALLRKHKGFSRGGSELEIYDLPGG